MHIGPFPSTIFQNSLHHFSTFRNFPFSVLSVLSNYLVEKSSVGRTLFVLSITDFLTTLNMTSITTPDAPTYPLTSRHVAVIGCGAAGLAAARELVREGHRVVVFERGDQVGGTWVYNPKVESDQLGLDPRRAVVHSSLYESLRTNLPREIMGFRDFPFVAREDDQDRDPRRFPSHREVLMYLKEFAKEFGIEKLVRFETEVVYVGMVKSNGNFNKWKVRSKKRSGDEIDEFFDAVVVCAGHYTEPRVAEIPGIQAWPGKQIHSHSYRIPEPFRDQVVVLIGSSASGSDISRDLVGDAKEVHVASRTIADEKIGKHPGYDNMWLHSMIKSVHRDGSVIFHDGSVVFADVILHCTGYKYHFPFLETNGTVTVDDNRVGPLYKHVFPPNLAPWLSFVGVPMKLLPFPHWELQSKWIAGVLSDRISLPFEDDMMEDVTSFYSMLEVSGTPKRHTHFLDFHSSEYGDWLAVQSGCPSFEEWRNQMLIAVAKRHIHQPDTYRDQWDDEDLILQAHQDFIKYSPNKVNK